ncbi:MAG: PDZ domain-containing protein [Acidobacteriota bacterium]
MSAPQRGAIGGRRSRMSGTTWMFIGLLIFFITAGGFTAIVKQLPKIPRGNMGIVARKSYVGVDNFETAAGNAGVTFENVEPPGAPADKAGLVGGDIITTIAGQAVHSDSEMNGIMRGLPIGKTVDVVYLRDGETRNTKLTTISKDELDQLDEAYGARTEGRGQFGYEDSEANRVEIPGTKMFGVELGQILPNRPADIAGIKQGDIVIEFGGVPIRTTDEFLSRVRRSIPYSTVELLIIRNGQQMKIPVKMGKR